MTNQVAIYDLVVKAETNTLDEMKKFMKGWCKKWVFQLEQGDTGYQHYQCMISLKKKRRKGEIIKLIMDGKHLKDFRISAKCTKNVLDWSYQDKVDTRIEGPWTSDDEDIFIPRQVLEMKELYPWQQSVIDTFKKRDTMTINQIICMKGNIGKSSLVSYCRAYKKARSLPLCNDYQSIMRMAYKMPVSKAYLIDMPKAINKEKLFQFYADIETLKDGYMFDCPTIWIFENRDPDETLLSNDRWKFWTVNDEKQLVPWKKPDVNVEREPKRQRID